MNRTASPVEFDHNGEEIKGTLFTYHGGVTSRDTLMFMYKNNNIHISLDEDENYYFVAPLHCKIIDKLGFEGYGKYREYLSTIDSIQRDYIIVNNEVYNYFCQLIIQSPKVYSLLFRLEGDTNLDGTNKLTTMDDRGNKKRMVQNIQSQANYYFKEKNVKPDQEQLNVEETQKYQESKKLIKEIRESL